MIEHMFEHGAMQTAAALLGERGDRTPAPGAHGARAVRQPDHVAEARAALERITSLRSRIADMEDTRVDTGAQAAEHAD